MMKRFFLMIAIAGSFGLVSCKSMAQSTGKNTEEPSSAAKSETQTSIYTEENGMLVGEIQRKLLEEGDYAKWFEPRYEAYNVVKKDVQTINQLLDGVDVTIFMGTWCPDSHREVPNFYKIMDAVKNAPMIRIIAVDHAKTTPAGLENGKDIQRVPTFIFTKNNQEMGRIVEYPIESLEKDMIKILKGEDYKHAYAK